MNDNPEFENIINTETWGPYGSPAPPQVKTGLTRRGKSALAVAGTVIAVGGMLTWQHYDSISEANEIKAQEIALQQQKFELEKLKVMNQVNTETAKTQATQDAANQKLTEACVDTDKGLVGKQLGITYSSVLSDCQAQYQATSTSGMQAAASATDTNTSGGGGVSPSVLVSVVAGGAILIAVAANRGKNTNAA